MLTKLLSIYSLTGPLNLFYFFFFGFLLFLKNSDVGVYNALLRTSQQLFSTFLHPYVYILKKEETGVTGGRKEDRVRTHTQKKVPADFAAAGGGLGRHSGD